MAFAKSSRKEEDIKQSGGSYINGSGIYPVNIIASFVSESKGGSESVDLFVEHNKQEQVLYGNMRVTNNDGSNNVIGAKVFNQLMIIADVDEVSDPVEAELPIGKKGKLVDCAVLEDVSDVDTFIRVQMEYSAHNGNIQEKKVIKGFYRAGDKATAEEIVNGTEPGAGYESDQKYVNNVTYKDDLTPEHITAWIAAKRPKGTAGDAPSASGNSKKPEFGNKEKRFGKKKSAE